TLSDENDVGDQRTIPPSHVMQGLTPRAGRSPLPPPPADLFESDEPAENTLRMPGTTPRSGPGFDALPSAESDGLTFTAPPPGSAAPPPPPPPGAPPPRHEETPMLAKTSPLTPEKLRLGRALLAG